MKHLSVMIMILAIAIHFREWERENTKKWDNHSILVVFIWIHFFFSKLVSRERASERELDEILIQMMDVYWVEILEEKKTE